MSSAGATSQPKIVNVVVSGTPDPKAVSGITAPGTIQTVINFVAARQTNLHQLIGVCRMDVTFIATVDGQPVGSVKTGPSESNSIFPWVPPYPVASGSTVTVTVYGNSYKPAADFFAQLGTAFI